ncbi:protein irg-1-like [Babylonia areolata]|uniref:protein irg-1-like n=1 Tax=Babylonia areolata TaxID=304850 RepID=UPI003FD29778
MSSQAPSKKNQPSGSSPAKEEKEEFEFFFGNKSPFSQHHPAKFDIDGLTYNCAEQYMMHQKAVLFKDAAMAKKIMSSKNPVEQKRFGRKVQNFDKDIWAEQSKVIVKRASFAKFSQNPELLKTFLATHPRTLVEAAPRDRLWGIGLGASNPKARDRSQWRGRNLLGQILTEVREQLRRELEEEEEEEEKEEEKKQGEKKEPGGGNEKERVKRPTKQRQ